MTTEPTTDVEVDEGVLVEMRSRCPGARWACYENQAMDSANFGHLQFLAVGDDCTFKQHPMQYPQDNANGMGWRYRFIGWVDLATGKVVRDG